MNAQEEVKFEKGRLVVPIVETEDEVKCFVPCGGLNDDDTVPYWAVDWKLDSFGINVPLQTYNDDKGIGLITVDKRNSDWANVVKYQEISDGDIVKVRNNFYEVLGRTQDAFKPNMLCARFKSNFIKNARSTAYSVLRQPVFRETL